MRNLFNACRRWLTLLLIASIVPLAFAAQAHSPGSEIFLTGNALTTGYGFDSSLGDYWRVEVDTGDSTLHVYCVATDPCSYLTEPPGVLIEAWGSFATVGGETVVMVRKARVL